MKYEPVIGLEVHLQVKTKSKIFCGCSSDYFGKQPNTFVCPVCLGMPGAMPVPNAKAVEQCLKLALGLSCQINVDTKFDRKNYFYPDLPKGYQISQEDKPFGFDGYLEFDDEGDSKRIRIARVHLEEDTGKSMHQGEHTLLDYNKSGLALIEIVTGPDFTTEAEVDKFAKRLRQIVRYLGISDADMEKGQMRFELNMSLRPVGQKALPGYKVEVKNIGSISVLAKVIASETIRQSSILEEGQMPVQETRGLKDMSGETVSLRVKEEAKDYRYFPEPDILPIHISDEQLAEIKSAIVELPQEKKHRYMAFGMDGIMAEAIIMSKAKADWYENAIQDLSENQTKVDVAKWFVGDLSGLRKQNRDRLADIKIKPHQLRALVQLMAQGKLSGSLAKQVLAEMYETGEDPGAIVSAKGLEVINSSDELEKIVSKIFAENPKVVEDAKKNPNAAKFFVGLVMRETKGRADHTQVQAIIDKQLALT